MGSVFGIFLVAAVIVGLFAIFNPIVGVVALLFIGLPLGFAIVRKTWQHAAPHADAGGPAVPSSQDASYEPVRQPEEHR